MAYEREIREAKKIGAGWMARSKEVEDTFMDVKKQDVAPIKRMLSDLQDELMNTRPRQMAAKKRVHERNLMQAGKQLVALLKSGEAMYKKHERWALAGPRENMRPIAKELNLGDPRSEPYQAVAKGIKSQLTNVSKQISSTQRAWKKDLKPALENQIDKAKALVKILGNTMSKYAALNQQYESEKARFVTLVEKTGIAAMGKMPSDTKHIMAAKAAVQKGEIAEEPMVKYQQLHQLFGKKRDDMEVHARSIEKNWRRFLKSFPRDYLEDVEETRPHQDLEKSVDEMTKRLRKAAVFYDQGRGFMEHAGWV